jgi:hypothetical protein
VSLVNGGSGGGETVPPTSAGGGTISELTSTDDSVTITDPEGPVTDLSVAGGGGGTEIVNGDDSVAATGDGSILVTTNSNGVSLFVYPGDPNGSVTALAEGDVCIDTNTPTFYQARGAGTSAWYELLLGQVGTYYPGAIDGTGFAVNAPDAYVTFATYGASFLKTNWFLSDADPNGVVTPVDHGDMCYDKGTPAIWLSQDGTSTGWEQVGPPGIPGVLGSGSPLGVVTPSGLGQLYYDTADDTGLWVSVNTTNEDWVPLGGTSASAGGLFFQSFTPGSFNVEIIGMGDDAGVQMVVNPTFQSLIGINSTAITMQIAGYNVHLYIGQGSPDGTLAAANGDVFFDTETPALWMNYDGPGSTWAPIASPILGSLLPTSAGAAGTLWNNLGIVSVA